MVVSVHQGQQIWSWPVYIVISDAICLSSKLKRTVNTGTGNNRTCWYYTENNRNMLSLKITGQAGTENNWWLILTIKTSHRTNRRWPILNIKTSHRTNRRWPILTIKTSHRTNRRWPILTIKTTHRTNRRWPILTIKTSHRTNRRWPILRSCIINET